MQNVIAAISSSSTQVCDNNYVIFHLGFSVLSVVKRTVCSATRRLPRRRAPAWTFDLSNATFDMPHIYILRRIYIYSAAYIYTPRTRVFVNVVPRHIVQLSLTRATRRRFSQHGYLPIIISKKLIQWRAALSCAASSAPTEPIKCSA
jgi:hypothetical protein